MATTKTRKKTRGRKAGPPAPAAVTVAVVVRAGLADELRRGGGNPFLDWAALESERANGSWASFFGTDPEAVVDMAMQHAAKWSSREKGYEVWVGALTAVVQRPRPVYKVVQL